MEIGRRIILLVLALILDYGGAELVLQDAKITSITRQNIGDQFTAEGVLCNPDTCVGLSSGTAGALASQENGKDQCTCQCHSHLPAFREDLQICVDDIHECVLSPFVSSSMSQQIPFVFLPLKGQIIHPSKEISFQGIQTPVCAVSGAKFLTDGGWIDLRNPLDTDVPFRLFRDEGRTFLQWVGEPELRARMNGRLVLVHLMCREIANVDLTTPDIPHVFTPCVAFRIVGTPIKHSSNVSEVIFAPDAHSGESQTGSGLSVSEYVAIGVCSVLLGLIYVASVFLYLHLRKRRKEADKAIDRRDTTLASAEEGIIKNNPLLGLGRHFQPPDNSFSDSCSSDNEIAPDIIQHHDDRKKNLQITAAMIHPQHSYDQIFNALPISSIQSSHQESIERLPEENVSIVETLEGREERPDTVKVIGTTRRKLYFNPAYFEPQLLIAPPPAAIEFLTKIREVISIAKQKMASKKFTPSLLGIPEEDPSYLVEPSGDHPKGVSRRSSMISLKRENSRRKTCSGCPGCEPQDFKALSGKLPEFPSFAACHNCANSSSDSKQNSIRKWLEDIPVVKQENGTRSENPPKKISSKRIRSPTRSLSPDHITPHIRTLSPRPQSERGRSPIFDNKSSVKSTSSNHSRRSLSTVKTANSSKRIIVKPKAPPPPLPPNPPKNYKKPQNIYDVIAEPPLPPPDMIHEAMAVYNKIEEPKIPTITKKKMNAVINELVNLDQLKIEGESKEVDYEADSLERSKNKGLSTPPDYADITSQPSPSLSSALPLDEEMTMRNAIINTKTGNMTISKLNMEEVLQPDEHDYELIILKKGENGNNLFKLPELLQRNNGYSLVSEVYVNNGYNYGSAPSTPSESNSSTLERAPKIIYEENKPGHLLIEVEDCPDNYIKAEDSDSFEPDTLDRKPKMKIFKGLNEGEFVDSLERPTQILLRSSGSFKKTESLDGGKVGNFNRNFGSLREIYEAKVKNPNLKNNEVEWRMSDGEFEGRILTLEERHCRRQRKSPTAIPPDVIPPNHEDEEPFYEQPKPPRKVEMNKPPLPPKNGANKSAGREDSGASQKSDYENCLHQKNDISILKNFIHTDDVLFKNGINNHFILQAATITTNNPLQFKKTSPPKKSWRKVIKVRNKPDDSGYLSTDSNDSHNKKHLERTGGGSETDESLGDGHSESGAESIETHSVFFGSYRKTSCIAGSIDSGVGSDLKATEAVNVLEDIASSDSETMSYSTVVPLNRKQ